MNLINHFHSLQQDVKKILYARENRELMGLFQESPDNLSHLTDNDKEDAGVSFLLSISSSSFNNGRHFFGSCHCIQSVGRHTS